MVLREITNPTKLLYRFGPGFDEGSFNRPLTIRVHEIIAQATGLNATDDLGFIGCCAVTRINSAVPEVWLDFRFAKSTYADTTGFSGGATYYPKKELDTLENYLFIGSAQDNAQVIVRDIPEYNKRGEVDNVEKKVGVLRIQANLSMCLAVIANRSMLDPYFNVRFALTEHGNAYMGEYVDPDLVDKYLPIDVSLIVRADDSDEFKYDAVAARRAIEEGVNAAIAKLSGSEPKADKPVKKTKDRSKSDGDKSSNKEKKSSGKIKYGGKGGA